jgi:hypothetical protein
MFKTDLNSKHNYNCKYVYFLLRTLYHWPEDGPFEAETCCCIKDITYNNSVDGILFLLLKMH